ncbi:MAG: chemotaxis protein CheD [Clostridia bacterium]|nr:chemotaxis protein CheD [Clostridia bacterium]
MATTIIGIADMNIVRAPDKISTIGLGSCCGVVLYDSRFKISGMVHVLLPRSTPGGDVVNKAKFADTGIVLLAQKLAAQMAPVKPMFKCKLAGGAHMFNYSSATAKNDLLNVGARNVQVCKEVLKAMRIPIVAEDTLGTYGRTITFDPETEKLLIKTAGQGERTI